MSLPLSETSEKVLSLAEEESRAFRNYYIGTEHVFIALMRLVDADISSVLQEFDLTATDLAENMRKRLKAGAAVEPRAIPKTPRMQKVQSISQEIARRNDFTSVEPLHILWAMIHEGMGQPVRMLKEMGVDTERLRMELILYIKKKQTDQKAEDRSKNTPFLNKVGRDLTAMARAGQLVPIIGREEIIRRVAQVLTRKTKNNPIILGDAGVGKTAVVEGLAQSIVDAHAPLEIRQKRIIEINFGSLLSGTKYRGEFEQKIQEMIEETKKNQHVVLFIDEFHTIAGTGKTEEGTLDAANILKPALTRGEIRCIGATTIEDYRRIIEKDPALERRFQTILLDEPSAEQTLDILKGIRESYESHHRVQFTDEALKASIDMSVRYIWDRRLPDKAIDLLDQAAAQKQLHTLVLDHNDFKELSRGGAKKIKQVTAEDIAMVVSEWTLIPVNRLTEAESEKLLRLPASLSGRVIGQEEAIETVARVVRNAKVGLDNPGRPNGVFLFLGPSGVGKTELAKALAEFLFENESLLVRFDMSEFQESHTTSKLIGAPPGYIGYEQEGQLTKKIRTNPYSVLLFDEIEKAHEAIFDIFLQIFDEGILTDSHGRRVNFCNTIIIMTSNIGADIFGEKGDIGFSRAGDDESRRQRLDQRVREAVKSKFRPELLNRIDQIVIFRHLKEEHLRLIINKFIRQLNERLKERELSVELDESAYDTLINIGYSHEYGAREMERTINRTLSSPLAEQILEGRFTRGDIIHVSGSGDSIVIGSVPVEVA